MTSYRYKGDKSLLFEKIKKISGPKREISVILPTYNEEGNIENLVGKIKKELKGVNFEIIIVDDDSIDGTSEIIDKIADNKIIALHRHNKRGLLSALLDGIFISNGKYIIIMDSDFSHPPTKIKEFLRYKKKYDIVSGSRFAKGGEMKAPFFRKYGSLLITKLCAFIINLKIKDAGGGFHLMEKEKFNQIKFKYKSLFGEFDFELFYRAKKLGFRTKEVPFTYRFREKGSSKMSSSIFGQVSLALHYLKRAFQLRFLD